MTEGPVIALGDLRQADSVRSVGSRTIRGASVAASRSRTMRWAAATERTSAGSTSAACCVATSAAIAAWLAVSTAVPPSTGRATHGDRAPHRHLGGDERGGRPTAHDDGTGTVVGHEGVDPREEDGGLGGRAGRGVVDDQHPAREGAEVVEGLVDGHRVATGGDEHREDLRIAGSERREDVGVLHRGDEDEELREKAVLLLTGSHLDLLRRSLVSACR